MKHQCHPLSGIFLRKYDNSKYKTEVFTSASQKCGFIFPLCVMWPPFQKYIDNLVNPYVFLLGLKPFPIATFHHKIFLQMNDPRHLENHMPALPDDFSGLPLTLLTNYLGVGGGGIGVWCGRMRMKWHGFLTREYHVWYA